MTGLFLCMVFARVRSRLMDSVRYLHSWKGKWKRSGTPIGIGDVLEIGHCHPDRSGKLQEGGTHSLHPRWNETKSIGFEAQSCTGILLVSCNL